MHMHDRLTGYFTCVYTDVEATGAERLQRPIPGQPEQLEHSSSLIIHDLEKVRDVPEWNDKHVSGTDRE